MKIEAGKYYRTRGGDKVFVGGFVLPSPARATHSSPYPVRGYIGSGDEECWTADGFYRQTKDPSFQDLVEEWREPRKVEINVWERGNMLFPAAASAGSYPNCRLIAKATIIEGDGM